MYRDCPSVPSIASRISELLREAKILNYPGKCDILQTVVIWRKSMELTEELKGLFRETAKQLKGSARRLFFARTVKALGPGRASRAEQELGWNRKTIRKGMHELESGLSCVDAFGRRGRKRAEEHLPNLLRDRDSKRIKYPVMEEQWKKSPQTISQDPASAECAFPLAPSPAWSSERRSDRCSSSS